MASTDNKLFRETTAQAMLAEMVKQSNYLSQLTCEATEGLKGSSGAGLHNSFFRGKNLGSALTAAQSAAIRAGTFDDMFVGDYWPMNVTYTYKDANDVDQTATATVNFRIGGCDYYLGTGDQGSGLTAHHLVIVPDTVLYTARMNATDTTEGGYVGSEMYTKNLARAKALITAAFGSGHILTHREVLCNSVTDGKPTMYPNGYVWLNSTVELMTEQMVYGGKIFAPTSDGETVPSLYTMSKSQLPLFAYRPDLESTRSGWYWLRDVVSGVRFAHVGHYGNAYYYGASNSGGGVRPDSLPCNIGHSFRARFKGRKACPLCLVAHK